MLTILGAGGTIGKDLSKDLRTYTDQIRLVSRNPASTQEGDVLFPADLSIKKEVFRAVEGSDVVYLTVGFDYSAKVWRERWPDLMKNTIEACHQYNAKLVFFDNVYMYDQNEFSHLTEETKIKPCSKKGEVRAEIAQMLMQAVEKGEITALIARSADFYGPKNDKSALIELVYKNLLKNKTAQWFLDIHKKHSFTFTPDAAKATAQLGNTPDAYNQVWHLPTHAPAMTGKEWISLFARIMDKKDKSSVLPKWLIPVIGLFVPYLKEVNEMVYQFGRDYYFDCTKFENKFGWKATTPEVGVRRTVDADL